MRRATAGARAPGGGGGSGLRVRTPEEAPLLSIHRQAKGEGGEGYFYFSQWRGPAGAAGPAAVSAVVRVLAGPEA